MNGKMPVNNCSERWRLMRDRDRDPSPFNKAAYQWHLEMCPECRVWLVAMAEYAERAVMPEFEE